MNIQKLFSHFNNFFTLIELTGKENCKVYTLKFRSKIKIVMRFSNFLPSIEYFPSDSESTVHKCPVVTHTEKAILQA